MLFSFCESTLYMVFPVDVDVCMFYCYFLYGHGDLVTRLPVSTGKSWESLNPAHGEVYLIQHYVMFVSDL